MKKINTFDFLSKGLAVVVGGLALYGIVRFIINMTSY